MAPNSSSSVITDETFGIIILNTQNVFKLTGPNYPTWRVQLMSLLVGYDLMGFVDGTTTPPAETDKEFKHWTRQDRFILHAITSSVHESVINLLGSVTSSREAWSLLSRMFANKSRARIMSLKERLIGLNKHEESMIEYLQWAKGIADELSIIGSFVDDSDLVIHTLNGLPSEFKELCAVLRSRDTPISFEDLFDKLVDQETYILRQNRVTHGFTTNASVWNSHGRFTNRLTQGGALTKSRQGAANGSQRSIICQYCEKPWQTAKVCRKLRRRTRQHSSVQPGSGEALTRTCLAPTAPGRTLLDTTRRPRHTPAQLDQPSTLPFLRQSNGS